MRNACAGFLFLIACSVTAVAQYKAPRALTPPHTADGRPDLHGVWVNASATPLERPPEVGGKVTFTAEEVAELQRRADRFSSDNANDAVLGDALFLAVFGNVDRLRNVNATAGATAQERRIFENRTSLIVDPPDGRIPYTAHGKARADALIRARLSSPDNPENLANEVRCLTYETPRLRGGQLTYVDIVQTKDYVVLSLEQIHETRIVPLNGSPHEPPSIRRWNGDSRGHWEGRTLVIDTTNFTPANNFVGSDENLHLIERITLVGADRIDYETTLDDPTAWTRPWTALVHMTRSPLRTFEVACHEGNHAMIGILSGARAEQGSR